MSNDRYIIAYGPAQIAKEQPHRKLDTCRCSDEMSSYQDSESDAVILIEQVDGEDSVQILEPVVVEFDGVSVG